MLILICWTQIRPRNTFVSGNVGDKKCLHPGGYQFFLSIYLHFLKKVYTLRTNLTEPLFVEKYRVYLLLFEERKSQFLQTNSQVENQFNSEFWRISLDFSLDTVYSNNIFFLLFFFGFFCMSLFFVSFFCLFVCVCVFAITFLEKKGIHSDTHSNMWAGKLEKYFCVANFQKQDYLFFLSFLHLVKTITIHVLKRQNANLAHFRSYKGPFKWENCQIL